ncbi:unnamed protein product [Psylliodes chrysocephalus]|uniref:Uncharacterized protein n=1 Tax=Psylliodes chrysocephalus TaxID=3402493 RepID=A0A9P0GJS7_9CUCU|nr:unnamed protein product [Psylliodes chrysocephala]
MQASIRLGMHVIKFSTLSWGMFSHFANAASISCATFPALFRRALILLLSWSGEHAGQSKTVTPSVSRYSVATLLVWGGALLCIKIKLSPIAALQSLTIGSCSKSTYLGPDKVC